MTVPTTAWNETQPQGTEDKSLGDNRITEMKTQLREVLAVNHEMSDAGQGADWGKHNVVEFLKQNAAPSTVADEIQAYGKDVDAVIEWFIKDGAGNEVQMTSGGVIKDVSDTGDQTVAGAKRFTDAAGITLQHGNIIGVPYTTGNIDVTNGSTSVSGTGSLWETALVRAGNYLHRTGDNDVYKIASVDGETDITLSSAYQGETGAGVGYSIYPALDVVALGEDSVIAPGVTAPDDFIDTDSLVDLAVETAKIADAAVTPAKMSISAPDLGIGTYSGDGTATQAITGTGIDLSSGSWIMVIWPQHNSATSGRAWKTSSDGIYSHYTARNAHYVTDLIVSGDADGFTVGDGSGLENYLNYSGRTYTYAIFKAT